jgi:hypothetical protein
MLDPSIRWLLHFCRLDVVLRGWVAGMQQQPEIDRHFYQ